MFDEEKLEKITMDLLSELEYETINGYELKRENYSNVILDDELENSLIRLNKEIYNDEIREVIRLIKNLDRNNTVSNNKQFTSYLLEGVKIPITESGTTRYKTIKIIDFNDIRKNKFKAINQYTIVEESEKRPDIIIFINGMPLIVIELKSTIREEVKLEDGYRQLKGYQNVHIPSLFYYNQILIVSDGAQARAGTITSPWSRFSEWKKIEDTDEIYENMPTHISLIKGMLRHERILEIISNYILWSEDNKILAAYHQYFGVKKAIVSTLNAFKNKTGKAGILWHTQGSGKSFSMVFYSSNMIKILKNPSVVVVTDRNDLDNQLFLTFSHCSEYLKQSPIQIESRRDLNDRLENRISGGIFFTTLQKFEEETGLFSKREDILILVDEAHRSHYGIDATMKFDKEKMIAYKKYGTAKYLHEAFPNATYIGFTGTPVETADKSTSSIFGNVIDIYDMTQAILDGSTVPIIYESRMARVGLNQRILDEIDNYYTYLDREEGVEEEVLNQSKKEMAKMQQIIEDPDRLELIVKDIIKEYEEIEDTVTNKAMVVAYSRKTAYIMYKKFLELRPEWKNKVHMVITSNNKDEEEMQKEIGSSKDKHQLEKDFKDADSEFKIAIVVDMWLTGFDVPQLGTMYVDKPMKAHNLMQAIARVNRVYKDKKGGLIVDYIGLKRWLVEALKTYTKRDQGKIIDNNEIIKVLMDKIELIRNIFYGFEYSHFATTTDRDKYEIIMDAANWVLKTDKIKKEFMKYSYDCKSLYALCAGELEKSIKDEILLFIAVRSFITKINGDDSKIDISEINSHVAGMLERAIQDDEMLQIGNVHNSNKIVLLSDELINKISKMQKKNIAVEILNKALKDYIEKVGKQNIVLMEKFSTKFKKIADAYNERISIEDIEKIIQEMIQLKIEIEKELAAGNEYNLSIEEKAFFDALGNDPQIKELMKDETLVKIAKELVDIINNNMTIDWDIRKDARARMRYEIKKLLIKYNYPPIKREDAVQLVIKQAELKCKNMIEE